jgi:nicotinate-nucleotide adenylyltransferase
MMQIGLMGGTFNPFHRGHLETALELKNICHLDKVIIVPCNTPPHKIEDIIISPIHRFTMAVLGTYQEEDLQVSPLEMELGGISYTYRTIKAMKEQFCSENRLFYLTGVESFEKITTWRKWKLLIESIDFVVHSREGYQLREIFRHMPEELIKRCVLLKEDNYPEDYSRETTRIFVVDVRPVAISGSMIREKLRKQEDVDDLLPAPVAAYIKKTGIYNESRLNGKEA